MPVCHPLKSLNPHPHTHHRTLSGKSKNMRRENFLLIFCFKHHHGKKLLFHVIEYGENYVFVMCVAIEIHRTHTAAASRWLFLDMFGVENSQKSQSVNDSGGGRQAVMSNGLTAWVCVWYDKHLQRNFFFIHLDSRWWCGEETEI
jgi:hypothetical protein